MNASIAARRMPKAGVKAAWTRYAAVATALGLLLVIILFGIWPLPYAFMVQRVILPSYEAEFGFHGGMIRPAEFDYSVYGIASVVPGGRLDRAGVRVGDIPVEYHGGMWSFYYALEEASEGREATFAVVADLRDWYRDRQLARQITLVPRGKSQ